MDETKKSSKVKKDKSLKKNSSKFKKPLRYFKIEQDDGDQPPSGSATTAPFVGEDVIDLKQIDTKFLNKKKSKKFQKRKKKFLPDEEVDPKRLQKYTRGYGPIESDGVKTDYFKTKFQKKEIYMKFATEQAARTEILRTEEQGYLEPDEEERTLEYRQEDIVRNVDITSASKFFKLNLEFGPYHHRYTKNGRHLLLGGRRGHIASFDWITKKLHCEINVMEEVADISWLHLETMFAVAQKNWTYFYDKKGIELHCVKSLYSVNKLEFLPYHFLLATASSTGFLSWLDITLGECIGQYNSKLGDIRLMCQNPMNGVLCIGGGKGVVSMWTPKVKEPVAKLLCHPSPMTGICVDPKGNQLLTAGLDRKIKIWDIRNLDKVLSSYDLRMPANHLAVSQKGLLSFSMGAFVEVYKGTVLEENSKPYLKQKVDSYIHDLKYCPYEDILGISHAKGFLSMLVPGSGEPNFDSYEANPLQTKSQRRENEIHAILEKIPPELIALDPNEISGVDVEKLQERVEAKKQVFFVKPPQIDFTSRRKMKGKGGSAKAARNKQIVKEAKRKEFITDLKHKKKVIIEQHKNMDDLVEKEESKTVLDRFKNKKKVVK